MHTIADEIWSGVFRTGRFLAVQALHARPSMVVLSKGLSASLCKHSAVLVHRSLLLHRDFAARVPRLGFGVPPTPTAADVRRVAADADEQADGREQH
ncbi:MAG: hypothetical protein VXZ78_07260, partial [Pseudomonadota bacterium]|nr:hypothetical protein [Pseudomonadota bacterium]